MTDQSESSIPEWHIIVIFKVCQTASNVAELSEFIQALLTSRHLYNFVLNSYKMFLDLAIITSLGCSL